MVGKTCGTDELKTWEGKECLDMSGCLESQLYIGDVGKTCTDFCNTKGMAFFVNTRSMERKSHYQDTLHRQ